MLIGFAQLKMYLPDSAFCLDLLNGKASSIFVGNAFMHSAALPLQIGRVNGKTSKCLGKNLKKVLEKTIQQTAEVDHPFGTDKSVPYESLIG